MSSKVRIKEFPKDGNRWRVDWLGAIERGESAAHEPSIQVALSPINDAEGVLPQRSLAGVRAVDHDKQIIVSIHCGQLPIVAIGSVWKNRYLTQVRAGEIESLPNIIISPETVKWLQAKHKPHGGSSLIPWSHYRYSRVGASSWLAAIEHQGDPYGILIPAMELIRFYYATSTPVTRAIFNGDFTHNKGAIFNKDKSGYIPEEKKLHLQLRQGYSRVDGWTIGRILMSDETASSVAQIHDEMMKNNVNRQPVQVQAGFPFEGGCHWSAYCKNLPFWVEGEEDKKWRKLVLSLKTCSAPFPFERLAVTLDNNNDKANPDTDIPPEQKKTTWGGREPEKLIEDVTLQSEEAPNSDISGVEVELPNSRFSAIAGKEIERLEKEFCEYQRSGAVVSPGAMGDEGSTEKPIHGNNEVFPTNLVNKQEREHALGASFDAFKQAIEILNSSDEYFARVRGRVDSVLYLPLTNGVNCAQWSYLDSTLKRPRCVIAADIEHKGCWHTLIEFELRPSEAFRVGLVSNLDGSRLTVRDMYTLLTHLARKQGVWANIEYFHGLPVSVKTLKHSWANEQLFAVAIKRKLSV